MLNPRFQVRRRMAKTAFITIILLTVTILGIVFFGSATTASNLQAATPVLITLVGSLIATVGHYNQLVYSTDKGSPPEKDKVHVE